MTVKEIFSRISSHQVEGMMLHNDMADYYDFLGLHGFKRMHEYQFLSESMEMRGVHRYYINHYNALPMDDVVTVESNIPKAWEGYSRKDVEMYSKRTAIIAGFAKWCEWERKTKLIYENAYCDLVDLKEIASADKIKSLILAVDQELKRADRLEICLKSMDYDMPAIICMQDDLHAEYEAKMRDMRVEIC